MQPQTTIGRALAAHRESPQFQATKALLTAGNSLQFSQLVQGVGLTHGLNLAGVLTRTPTFYTSAIGHLLLNRETIREALSKLTNEIQRPVFLNPLVGKRE